MFAYIESRLHRLRRRLSRTEWTIRHLGLTPLEGAGEEPGLLLIQIDGLARSQLARALQRGRMPFLRRLLRQKNHALHTFYSGLPSTTPAVQAELYYGVRSAVPAFCFLDRGTQELGRMYYPAWAKRCEAGYAEQAEGLLKGGSSWANIYTGGAAQGESHFCAASNGLGDMWRTGKIRNILGFILLHATEALRITGLSLLELLTAFMDALDGIRRGRALRSELPFALSRVFISIGLRELVTIGARVDVARGLPVVHVNFLGYDEQSHCRGPDSYFAHRSLRGIDRAVRQLWREAHRSARRDYAVWIFSDHGQERTRLFATGMPGGIEGVIREAYPAGLRREAPWRSQQRPPSLWWRNAYGEPRMARLRRDDVLTDEEKLTFTVAAVGPVGHVYCGQPLPWEERLALAHRLVGPGRVPGVLLRNADGAVLWVHARGETPVPGGVPALLPHPGPLRAEIARDLAVFCAHPDAGDLILLG